MLTTVLKAINVMLTHHASTCKLNTLAIVTRAFKEMDKPALVCIYAILTTFNKLYIVYPMYVNNNLWSTYLTYVSLPIWARQTKIPIVKRRLILLPTTDEKEAIVSSRHYYKSCILNTVHYNTNTSIILLNIHQFARLTIQLSNQMCDTKLTNNHTN